MAHVPVADDVDDRELVQRAQRGGDMAAFESLYRRHVHRVHAFAYRRSGSEAVADDVTSATFEQALRNLGSFRWRGAGFGSWLLRIASSELANHYRAEQRGSGPRGQAWQREPAAQPGVDDTVLDSMEAARLREALGRLSLRYQQVLSLRYLAELSHTETADVLGMPKPLLAVTVHRALAALGRELEREGEP